MYVTVAHAGCIGCGACIELAPNVFIEQPDQTAKAILTEVLSEDETAVRKAARLCPADVIYIDE